MEQEYFRNVMTTIVLIVLVVLTYFLLKPILLSIILGVILAFVFTPIYKGVHMIVRSKNLAAFLVSLLLMLLILLPVWFVTPIAIEQSFKMFQASQQIDFVTPLKAIFPSLFASDAFSAEIGSILSSFVTRLANSLVNTLSNVILNFPTIFLQSLVMFFTFYFILRDKESVLSYLKTLSPFSKEIEKKFFKYSKDITSSVIYGQVILGALQGILVGIGLFIFKVPNALVLAILASMAGIFPIIGTTIIWLPVAIYLLIGGNTFAAVGIIIFGMIAASLDNMLRPYIVSKRTEMPSSLVLIGMVGGLFLFGILGFILGPLILAYLMIILEIYKNKKSEAKLFVQ